MAAAQHDVRRRGMGRAASVLVMVLLAMLASGLAWWFLHRESAPRELALFGNVDLREVDLAFNNSERIAAVLVQEGDRVHRGQILARLDTSRLQPQVAQAAANVELARVDTANARRQFARLSALSGTSGGRAVSRQDLDNAKAALDSAAAREQADEAQFELLRQQLADAQLAAPADATVRSRIMEPGEMASPQKPVFDLAITSPKWVRVYVSEPDLGRVRPGMRASVSVDSFPHERFPGWVGFVSSVAEFTPKTIETEDLRPSLVYEVRVFVQDPGDRLRLGMPATVHLPLAESERGAGRKDGG